MEYYGMVIGGKGKEPYYMNEFLIQLQAILDKETSKGNINKSIEEIQNQINKLKIQAEVDPKSIQSIKTQLEQVINQKITLSNIGVDQGQIDKIGQRIGKGVSDSIQRGMGNAGINTDKLNADIKTLKNNLSNFASKNTGFDTFKTDIRGVEVSLESLMGKLASVNNAADFSTIRSQANALRTAFAGIVQADKIQFQVDTGGYESKVESLISRTKQWTDGNGNARISTDALKQSLDKLNAASAEYANNKTAENHKKLIQSNRELDKRINEVTNSIRTMNAELAKDSAIASLHNKIQSFYDQNTAAHGRWGAQLKQMLSQTASGAKLTTEQVRAIEQAFNGVTSAAQRAGKVGKSWFQTLKESTKIFSAWTSPAAIMMKGIAEVKQGLNSIRELDTALVDLKKTTTMTSGQLEQFYYDSNETAKQMGVTAKEIIDQASAWSRLGFSSAESAAKMAKYSSMFATISPGMDLDSATDGLVSVMKAFKIGLEDTDDVVDGIMSKINVIGNTQALSNNDIVEFLTRSSSAMAEANNSLEETIALGTAAVEITRNAASVGNALKTVSMRIRGYDEETKSYTNDVENLSGIIANLTKTASTPGGISLFTDKAKTEFKSTKRLFDDIAKIYGEMADKDQAALLEALGGKHQGQVVGSILNNYDTVRKSMDSMAESAGNADAEMSVALDSVDVKLNQLKETGTGIAQNLFNRGEMKSVISGLTSFMGIIDSITSKIRLFGVLGAGAGLFAGIKNTGLFRSVQSTDENGVESTRLVTSMQARRLAQEELNASLARQAAQLEVDTAALRAYETECAKGAVTTGRFAAIMQGASAEAQAYAVETNGAAGSAQAFAARQGQVQAELQATANASRAGEAAINGLKTAFNMIAFTVVAMGIQMAVTALDNWIHRVERAMEALEEAKNRFSQTTDEIKSLNDELTSTQGKIEELQALADNGTISVADENELKLLKETNKELQRKIALKQKEQIDDANDLLKKAREANAEQAYSYAHYNPDGEYVTERKYGDASDQLQDTIKQYQDAVKYFGADGVNPENYNDTISEQAETVGSLIEAYQSLEDAGISLSEEQQKEYDSALKAQDAYLLYSYNLNKTKEGFQALHEEQQRAIIQNKLIGQGLSDMDAKAVLRNISNEDLDDYYDLDFSFPLPDRNDFKTAEEYGKAYADAWKNGVEEAIEEDDKPEKVTTISGILAKYDKTKDIENYNEKVSSLQSYLDKLESGRSPLLIRKRLQKSLTS